MDQQDKWMTSSRPDRHRMRSQPPRVDFLGDPAPNDDRNPHFDKTANQRLIHKRAKGWKRQSDPFWILLKRVAAVAKVAVLILAVSVPLLLYRYGNAFVNRLAKSSERASAPVAEVPYANIPSDQLRMMLDQAARDCLAAVLNQRDPDILSQHVIHGGEKRAAIRERLESDNPLPHHDEFDLITAEPVNQRQLNHGIFALQYYKAGNPSMTESQPLPASPKAQDTTIQPDLLDADAFHAKAANRPPRQRLALAMFSYRDGTSLLDWDLFIQTWDHSLEDFLAGKLGDGPRRFRVTMALGDAASDQQQPSDPRMIRIRDPLHLHVGAFAIISPDDLALVALRTADDQRRVERTATVDLTRNPDDGQLRIQQLVCTGYLGLDGCPSQP